MPTRLLLLSALSLTLTGCAFQQPQVQTTPGTALSGTVHGGQQSVSGSTIQLYAAGTTGYASAATPLLTSTITTDANGNFLITGDYTCPTPTTQVYLTATGGNPGLSPAVNNTALALMVALGNCGNLSSTERVIINEVTTIAAVWSLQQFMSSYANVGSSATNTNGLTRAMTSANAIVGAGCGCANQNPSTYQNPYPSPIFPQNTVNSLANALAACVNSNGSTSAGTACALLFAAATPSGSAAPTNTIAAALNIAQNPAANVAAIFTLSAANAPFQPTLPAAPNDWTLAILYQQSIKFLNSVAMDSNGNFWWGQDYYNSSVNTVGPYYSDSFTLGSNYQLNRITFDAANHLWESIGTITGTYTPCVSSSTGLSYCPSGAQSPPTITFDSADNGWMMNGNALTIYSSTGAVVVPATSGSYFGTVPDSSGNMWTFSAPGTLTANSISGSTLVTTAYTGPAVPSSTLNFDHTGAIWSFGSASSNSLVKYTVSGSAYTTAGTYTGGGLNTTSGAQMAVDGNGNVWTANTAGSNLSEFSNAGIALSPSTGYGTFVPANIAATFGTQPISNPVDIGIDLSGDVWIMSPVNNPNRLYPCTIADFLGIAAPANNPAALAAATNTIGVRP